MKSFQQYITEVFDKPYKWKDAGKHTPEGGIRDFQKGNFTGKKYEFDADDGRKVEVYIYEWNIVPPKPKFPVSRKQGRVMEMHFSVDGEGINTTGEGDAMRIFATVLDVVTSYVKKNKPDIIKVIGVKTKDAEIGSRLNLYQKLVKRYAPKLGYKYDNRMITIGDMETPDGLQMSVMILIRKGFGVV